MVICNWKRNLQAKIRPTSRIDQTVKTVWTKKDSWKKEFLSQQRFVMKNLKEAYQLRSF